MMDKSKSKQQPSDARIVERVQRAMTGQVEPTPTLADNIDHLFAKHQDRIYHLCLKMTGNPELARELTQDTLLTAYRKLPEFRGSSQFGTWIYGIARNLCLNAIRKRGELLAEDGVLEAEDDALDVLGELRRTERAELLRQAAMAVLDEQEQEAVHLRYVEGLPQAQISEILNLSGSGARGLLQRCRRKLGKELRSRLAQMGHGTSFIHQA